MWALPGGCPPSFWEESRKQEGNATANCHSVRRQKTQIYSKSTQHLPLPQATQWGDLTPRSAGSSGTPASCLWRKLGGGISGLCRMASPFCFCVPVRLRKAGRRHTPLPARLSLHLHQASLHHTLEDGSRTLAQPCMGGHGVLGPRPTHGGRFTCCSSCPQKLCGGSRRGTLRPGPEKWLGWGGDSDTSVQPRWPFLLFSSFPSRHRTQRAPGPHAGHQGSLVLLQPHPGAALPLTEQKGRFPPPLPPAALEALPETGWNLSSMRIETSVCFVNC